MRYFIINKPYGMICQFSQEAEHPVLGELYNFPKDVYPVGRLDTDSEGLLIITNDKSLNNKILNPNFEHQRSYLVQVDGDITPEAIMKLEKGVDIRINGKSYKTKKAKVEKLESEPEIAERNPPIRYRKNIPTSWIKLSLTEGKNRQVRRMTANVGFPTLRLIRVSIENLNLNKMQVGDVVEMSKDDLYKVLNI